MTEKRRALEVPKTDSKIDLHHIIIDSSNDADDKKPEMLRCKVRMLI